MNIYLDSESLRMLYIALVRPHLEFGKTAQLPRFQKGKNFWRVYYDELQKLPLVHMILDTRLARADIPSIAHMRVRGDMTKAFKYTHVLYKQSLLQLEGIKKVPEAIHLS